MLGQIVRLQLNRIKKRVAENHKIPFEYSDEAVKLIVKRCNDAESGGRIIDSILTNTVLPKVSIEYLSRAAEGSELKAVAPRRRRGRLHLRLRVRQTTGEPSWTYWPGLRQTDATLTIEVEKERTSSS